MNNLFVIELALIATGSATLHNFALIAVTCKAIEPLSHWAIEYCMSIWLFKFVPFSKNNVGSRQLIEYK